MMQFFRGASDLVRGGRYLLAHGGLWPMVIAPALVTLVLVVGIIYGLVSLSQPAIDWVAAYLPSWLESSVGGLLTILVVLALSIGGYLVFVSAAGAIAGPFCELLSEAVEARVTGRKAKGTSAIDFVRGLVMGLLHAARRLLVSLLALVLVFVLGAFIPIIGPVLAVIIGGYLAATSAAYDCFDAVLARRMWRYRQKMAYLKSHRARTLGLGAAVALLFLIPVLNLMALGVGACGATLAAIDLEV